MDTINAILKNPAFYAALIALLNALLDYFFPEFPGQIRLALNGLLTVIFAGITGVQTSRTVRAERQAKAVREAMEQARLSKINPQ